MRNPRQLWEAHTLAKAGQTRASSIYGIEDELAAYCFDRAVQTFASALEARLHEVSKKAKNEKSAQSKRDSEFRKWMSSDNPGASAGRFRDPMKS